MTPLNLRRRLRKSLLPAFQHAMRQAHDLRYLFVELTQRCNLACLHCGSDCSHDKDVPDLPAADVVRVLHEIRTRYDPHRITVVLTGGEPLCHPEVFEIGKSAHEAGFPWGMVSNGLAWNDLAFQSARAAHLDSITVSLDGLRAEHDWLRGRKGSFDNAVRTIETLVRDPFIQVMDVVTCVNRRNLGSLDRVRTLLVDMGVKRWRLFTISPIGRAPQEPDLFLDAQGYQELMRDILRWRKESLPQTQLSESAYVGPHLEGRVRDDDFFCRAGVSIASVLVNGDILACPNIDRGFRQGNIRTDSFVDVWENRYGELRDRRWMRNGACKDCSEWSHCHGGAFHLRDAESHAYKLCPWRDFELQAFRE
jgi:radical SAM enzyme (rSAM/lipoprotein system)